MINVNANGKDYSIRFTYNEAEYNRSNGKVNPIVRYDGDKIINPLCQTERRNGNFVEYKRILTTCQISEEIPDKQEHRIVGRGQSINCEFDRFQKDAGRKVAMSRALRQMIPGFENKEIRKVFWKAYFQNHKEGRRILESNKI